MTREEAIKLIDTHTVCFYNEIDSPTLQALHLAIEALQEPNMIPIKLEKRYPKSRDEDITDAFMQGYLKGEANRPKGEWIFNPTDAIDLMFAKPKCSKCGFESSDGGNFCPNCGAYMNTPKGFVADEWYREKFGDAENESSYKEKV